MDFTANDNVKTSTLTHLVAKTVDTILNFSPLTLKILGNQKAWKGSQMKFPVKYQTNSNGMSFDGLDKFDTTKVENFINMAFDPTGREMPVVISQMEADVNAAGGKVIDLVARQLASDSQDMASDIATLFYTLQTGKNFLSVIDAYDDGTIGATSYGGQTRSTYTGLEGNYTNISGNLTLTAMRTQMNACEHGPKRPDLIVTTPAVWGYYEKLLTPTVTTSISQTDLKGYSQLTRSGVVAAGADLKGQQGFNAIFYSGVPLVADEVCPSGYMVWVNTKDLAFYGVKSTHPEYKPVNFTGGSIESVYSEVPHTTGFSFSGFNTPIDQYGRVGHILLMGNLICKDPRSGGILIGITGA